MTVKLLYLFGRISNEVSRRSYSDTVVVRHGRQTQLESSVYGTDVTVVIYGVKTKTV